MPRYIDAENIPTKFVNFGMPTVISGIEVPDIDNAPTISPDEVRGVGCAYCKEDRDGYTMPLEKNAHAWVQYPNKLVIQFGKEIRKCEIKYCPMCGAKMKGAENGTTD